MSESSDVFHNDIRARYDRGETDVTEAMSFWADLTVRARDALLAGNCGELNEIMDANFDRRRALYKIHPDNLEMIDAARATGASAKFTGSGGAIVGLVEDDAAYQRLHDKLTSMGIHIFRPHLI